MRPVCERVLTVKLPASVDDGLNRHMARLEEQNPGLLPSKSDVVRALLTQALNAIESHTSR